ncbi:MULTISPECIES: hypothetical protein [unclassified Streptomyces]
MEGEALQVLLAVQRNGWPLRVKKSRTAWVPGEIRCPATMIPSYAGR